jgi:hypothetical protein
MNKIESFDILGQQLEVGNYIAVGSKNTLYICRICKITPKMIRATKVSNKTNSSLNDILIYSSSTVKLSSEDAMAYILKYAK